MDCFAPPSKGGGAIHQCPRADYRLLRGIFDRPTTLPITMTMYVKISVYLQNAMTSSEERPSASIKVAGCRPERITMGRSPPLPEGVPNSVLEQILGC